MLIKNHNFFFFLIFLTITTNKFVFSIDDSDILIDRVFMTAVKKSNYQKVEEMLDKDAAINHKDSNKLVALAYALENDDRKMFRLLVANGANPKARILNKSSLLIYYVTMNRYSLIQDLLESGVDPNFQDRLGMTALMHSIEKANVNAVNILTKQEINEDITDFSGKTIYDYSKMSRNLLIKKIIETSNLNN